MATFKMDGPAELTGNNEKDINSIYSNQCALIAQLNYILNNLDDENLNESILTRINGGN